MASTIKIKRSTGASAPVSLSAGELAWIDDGGAGTLYIGDATSGAIKSIGGDKGGDWGADLLNSTALTGTPTAPTAAADNNSTQVATTAYVDNQVLNATNAISQASDTNINAPSAAQILVYDGTDSWDNKSLSGDVTIAADGTATVNGVAANSVALGTDTTGNYVSTIASANGDLVVANSGVEQAAVDLSLPNDVTIRGNLTVQGTTTTVDSTTVTVNDPVFVIGEQTAGKDRGIEFKYDDGGTGKQGFFGYDDSAAAFTFIEDATNTSEVFSGTAGNVIFGDITGTLQTASQPNITGVGTISAGTWQGDIIDAARGGFGIDTSASTGVASVSGGTWSVASELSVALGGTGRSSLASGALMYGDGTNAMTQLAAGSANQFLQMNSGGTAPEWTDTMDGGTF